MLALALACNKPDAPKPEGSAAPAAQNKAGEAAEKSAAPAEKAPTPPSSYGKMDGKDVQLFTLTNKQGLVAKITNYGAIITEFHVPDKNGKLSDIVLGFDALDGYVKGNPYFGATVGRVANRIKNASFKLDGKGYELAANDPPHHLHGGKKGWDKVVWQAKPKGGAEGPALELSYTSPDGEEGYPGTVQAKVVYTLTNANELKVEMASHDRQADLGQHGAPQLLEPRRSGFGHHPRPRARAVRRSVHAGRAGAGRQAEGRERHAVRLHRPKSRSARS